PLGPAIATGIIAAMLALRRPTNPAGWLLGFFVVSQAIGSVAQNYLLNALYGQDAPQAFAVPVGLLNVTIGNGVGFLALVVLLLVFPDGRLLSRRWRIA